MNLRLRKATSPGVPSHAESPPRQTRPRVVLIAHDVHWGGGMERALAELIRGGEDEVDFEVVSMTLAEDLRPLVRWHRVRAPRRPFPVKFASFFVLGALKARRIEADLIHTCGAIVPMRADITSVHFCHRGFLRASGMPKPVRGRTLRSLNAWVTAGLSLAIERWCYRRGRTGVLGCVSPGLEREVNALYPEIITALTPNGVDLDRFSPDVAARDGLRAAEGVADDTSVVLFVGGDWHRKGLSVAIEALALCTAPDRPAPVLWVVGTGEIDAHRHLAESLGVAERVRFFGRRTDTDRFYSAADLFVLPSTYECFPLVALEASAAGRPVLGTAVHGLVDIVSAGGGVVVPRTPEDFAREMAALIGDPATRDTMGRAGRQFVSQFPWTRSVASNVTLYHRVDCERTTS